jgi:hypothetical protein
MPGLYIGGILSKWTHSLCDTCYQKLEPGRVPTRMKQADVEACCKCGVMHSSGIYYRCAPEDLLCQGRHD